MRFKIGDIVLAPNEYQYLILPNDRGMYKGDLNYVTLAIWSDKMFNTVVPDIPLHSFSQGNWKKVSK
jgi:hypothetical protein